MSRRPRSEAGTLVDQLVSGTRVPVTLGPPLSREKLDVAAADLIGGMGRQSEAAFKAAAEARSCTVTGCAFPHALGEHPATKVRSEATSDSWSDTWQTGAMLPTLLDPVTGQRRETEPAKKPPPALFASANLGDGVHPDFQRIVECTYAADAFRDYNDLEKNLEVGDQRGDHATLREHLDKAEARARRAHKLYLGSKLELVGWEADARKVMSAMREEARRALEDEKLEGTRKKVISQDDVEDRVADLFPDEWRAQKVRTAKLKGVVEDLEHLTRRWDAKAVDLRTMLETLRK
jgi:hypothetical protein